MTINADARRESTVVVIGGYGTSRNRIIMATQRGCEMNEDHMVGIRQFVKCPNIKMPRAGVLRPNQRI